MEQATKRQDRGDEGEKQNGAPAGAGTEPEEPFSLLQELPAPLMRQLVQRHLDAKDCLALLRTSHALARAAVQHRTHPQRRALTWTWRARKLEGSEEYSSMDEVSAAMATSLLVQWAPAELRGELRGEVHHHPAVSLPAAVLPLIASLSLIHMRLTPATIDSLQQCQRLHTLDVDQCSCDDVAHPQPATRALQALPLLRTLRSRANAWSPWAGQDLRTLCALATDIKTGYDVVEWAPHFTRVTRWDIFFTLDCHMLLALLRAPTQRHVQAPDLDLSQDHSRQACPWETLTVRHLGNAGHLLRLPGGVGHVVVTESLGLSAITEEELGVVVEQWCAPGQLRAEVGSPPDAATVLGAEEAQGGFFRLALQSAGAVTAHAALLRSTVLPQGGGPRTLWLECGWAVDIAHTLQHLAPLLAGTRVRTLCTSPAMAYGRVECVLSALPACITCAHLLVGTAEQAGRVLSGPAATHPLRLVAVLRKDHFGHELTEGKLEKLRELCAAHQPLVQLEVRYWGGVR